MRDDMLSVEDVAGRLGLHVRTVRTYVRDGRLKAVRIGKQYRIAESDLDAFLGKTGDASAEHSATRRRHVDVSSVVDVDGVDAHDAGRLSRLLASAIAHRRDGDEPLRLETVYDEHRSRLKIVIVGGADTTREVLGLISAMIDSTGQEKQDA
ncbi:helix-turn-helix domain-containing protein [Allosaccharopolyspora coralli]|uniref:Helix-turn-helix domain-containing protein n=1 Tax=Allosaccharopolyspora coralli TaxID=2665642 RepID=A0A5Q3QE71_9PSEU|nr:helix-turn-helix domain-containing protein [Allosaccharopolyspora coralli]QGK69805.1 helix-turn-helix domain-containing protein [Allosaccharopolyspora coralli]